MPKARLPLTTLLVALAGGCGGRHLQTRESGTGRDAAAPDGGTGDASLPVDGRTAGLDGAPPSRVAPVDPAVSRQWTWHACGQIAPAGEDTAALFGADGTVVVRSDDAEIRGYDAGGKRLPTVDGEADFLISAPDGAVLSGTATGEHLLLRGMGGTTPRFGFDLPSALCGHTYGFSVAGDYFLAHGGGASCIWRADGGFVASFPEDAAQAAVRGQSLVTLQARADGAVDVVTRDFNGRETGRVKLETKLGAPGNAVLSPAGDRVASAYPRSTLWDTDGHTLLALERTEGRTLPAPAFTAMGDRLLVGDGVFQTADGARTATLSALSRMYEAPPVALSPDGHRAISTLYGRAALFEVSAPGITAMLGPQLHRGPGDPIRTLAISRDSVLVAAMGLVAFGIRLAPRFEDSPTLWSIVAGDSAFVGEISDDGKWASAAGDNRVLYSGRDGQLVWPELAVPGDLRCFGSQLRLSPEGNWAAGASYEGTMDVFALAGAARAGWNPISVLPTACVEAAAFTRDERTMATSMPSLYRFDAIAGNWQPGWTAFTNRPLPKPTWESGNWLADVRFSPDETMLLVSHCDASSSLSCSTSLFDTASGELVRTLAGLTAPRPSFSPDGSWIIAGPTLLHLPSGDTRPLDPSFSTGTTLFTPDGDIVAGLENGTLARYCRDR